MRELPEWSYTPLALDEVEALERGEGFDEGIVYFVDNPDPEEATDDAIWIMVEIPEEQAIPFEDMSAPNRGYREFALPGDVASHFPARRAYVR